MTGAGDPLPPTVPLPYSVARVREMLGEDGPARLLEGFRWMTLARALDGRMLGLQRQGRIGFYGPATGQEAVSVGAGLVSREPDWIVPGLREQLVLLVRGYPLVRYMDHLFANDRDPARGRQMPCHPTGREAHYLSMSSVIGTQISHGVGLGFAIRHAKETAVAYTFFGDGATSSNDFHAGLNFAGVLGLPVVFCCTNNQWAISVPVERQTRSATLAEKARAYGIPGRRVDGTDLVEVMAALGEAAQRAREGRGPTMLEFVLYRMTPHSSSDDPTRYQAADWMPRALAHDPVRRLALWLEENEVAGAPERAALQERADAEVRAAIESSEGVPAPVAESLTQDVFADVRGGVR
jgi:pyruvate dehydrogenase E1 component alpha subunit